MIEVIWKCKDCGTKNTDDFSNTIWPICEKCNTEYFFEDILTSDQCSHINGLLAANLSGYCDTTLPKHYIERDDQYDYHEGEELYHVFERGRLNEFGERYCVQPFLPYEDALHLMQELNGEK